ncbi:mannose-1-phosphate guanylyltransferase [Mesonia aestuariivivens]|uniref:Mannose-1-phosphate guanylyltransferase n=1 Tax=Mesonia aestuariivivens TaxID=2796128 RepID=A0ABS6W4R1_9FLAO|nr:mannose-1-phosphate guanylyltransferase [Mesonia aestuariivivens]MBW2962704.1 mannose-1-phosphate guanylyltransferase [Mesonia aestuariivivens]
MNRNKNYYAILMAGGVGSRFWPVSKKKLPKQFHDILGTGETLIQRTFKRLSKLIPEENILILTNGMYNDLVKNQLPMVTDNQIILEPVMRNTAPCILLSALKIQKQNEDAIMVVAPSDHWIEDEDAFVNDLQIAFDACQRQDDLLMTLGIQPTFPHTGYGYIQHKEQTSVINKVVNFKEKPDYHTAKNYLSSGNYLWNAGIFIWSAKAITAEFKKHASAMYEIFAEGKSYYNTTQEQRFINENYEDAENISIDYAIMEKAENVCVIPASFDWNDLGSWGALHDELERDEHENVIINAKSILDNASNNIVRTLGNKLVVLKDIDNYIIVEDEEVLLVYPRGDEQGIKNVRNLAKEKFGEDLI